FSPATKGAFSKTVSIPAEEFGLPFTDPPDIVDQDNLSLYSFVVNTDKLTHKFPIPSDYAGGDITFWLVWTNDGGEDDNGKAVKWRLDYQVGDEGDVISGSHDNSPKSVEDTYDSDAGWVEHHTGKMTIAEADFSGKLCLFLKLSAVTPDGAALTCEPHLIGLCYTNIAKWGRKP
ncbi:unnamed protein product, partial [marine sediment metagenome]